MYTHIDVFKIFILYNKRLLKYIILKSRYHCRHHSTNYNDAFKQTQDVLDFEDTNDKMSVLDVSLPHPIRNSPCSLPNATRDPVSVTPPMKVPRKRDVLMTLAAGSVAKCENSAM